MRMTGRRKSDNVEDRRGMSGGRMLAGGGIGGIIIAALIAWITTGDFGSALQAGMESASSSQTTQTQNGEYKATPEEQELFDFASQILAGTEDVWTAEFRKLGKTYEPPKLVIFTNSVTSGCGAASSSSGPFYCSGDQTVYLDLSFFLDMKKSLGADGDFAYAYVIAHEVGHHVQYLLGTLGKAHSQMAKYGQGTPEANKISVRLELQADFYAGVWAYHDNKQFGSLEPGDVEEALDCASKIGDDYLQRKYQGRVNEESFNHGKAEQRHRWLQKGLQTGDITQGNTFDYDYSRL